MRIKATIVVSLKLMLNQWKQLLLMYCIFPLLLALVMGYFQKDSYRPEVTMDKIKITLLEQDKSESSRNFTQLFSSEEMKKLFEVTDKGDYLITIPIDYEKNLLNQRDAIIRVDERERISRNNEIIVRSLIEEYGRSISQAVIVKNKLAAADIEDKENFYKNIAQKISALERQISIKSNIQKGEAALTSYENQGASMITYFVIMIVMGCVAGYHMDKESGAFKRLMSTPITRLQFFNLDMLIFFIASFIYSSIYILTFRIAGLAFKGVNPAVILAILIAQSAIITALSGLLVAFIGKKNSNLVLIFIMYFQILFGGIFIPVKEVNNEIYAAITKFAPGNLLAEAYRSSMLFNSINKIAGNLLVMLIVAAVLYLISIIKVKVRWEE